MPVAGNTDNAYPVLLEQENKIKLLEPFKGAKVHTKMQCMVCNHIWIATPISKRQTLKRNGVSGCPACNIIRQNTLKVSIRQAHLKELETRGIKILTPGYDGRRHLINENTYTKLLVQNTKCGHIFECSPSNLISRRVECSICGPIKRVAPLTAWSKANSKKWRETATEWQKYKALVASLTEQTYKCYKKHINPNNLPRGKAGQEGAYHLDHIVPKRFCFDNNIPPEVCAHYTNLQMIGWKEKVGSRSHIKGTIPPVFFQYITAGTKLERYADQLMEIFPFATRFYAINDIITTIYDKDSNQAVVVIPIDKQHANQKSALAAYKSLSTANVQHIILFEDEMVNIKLLHAKLLHYSKQNNTLRIHARECDVRKCDKNEKRILLNTNHIQGNDNSQIAYGAYYNNKLVAVMTFSPPRTGIGVHKNKCGGEWELVRFCTDVNYRIPGIASKLLKHFQRNHEWTQIYSYADKRWSTGNLYYKLGFQLVANNPPDYFYVIDGERKHRWNYRKDILKDTLPNYDPKLTEYQNMVNHGYWRVWDCGTLKFVIHNK